MNSVNTICPSNRQLSNFNTFRLSLIFPTFLLISLAAPGIALAEFSPLQPYLGLDYYQRSLTFVDGKGKGNFNKSLPQGNISLGITLTENFSIEAGYLFSQFSSRTVFIDQNQKFLGMTTPPGRFLTFQNKINLSGPHIYLNAQLPIGDSQFQAIALMGVSQLSLKAQVKPIANQVGSLTADISNANTRNFSAKKVLFRGMVGLGYKLNETFGIRALIGYETTSKFKNMSPKEVSPLRMSLKNNILFSIGLTAKF